MIQNGMYLRALQETAGLAFNKQTASSVEDFFSQLKEVADSSEFKERLSSYERYILLDNSLVSTEHYLTVHDNGSFEAYVRGGGSWLGMVGEQAPAVLERYVEFVSLLENLAGQDFSDEKSDPDFTKSGDDYKDHDLEISFSFVISKTVAELVEAFGIEGLERKLRIIAFDGSLSWSERGPS